ncbi:MAG: putative acetyltransferase, partial [Akkermansiaceae bacterium]|nr:putative acetyltransferase [Akkermansiaceae bacterium]
FSGITIGAETLIGAGCLLCDSDMHEAPLGSSRKVATAPILIGRRVFIGAGSTVLKGVTIGDGAVVGAGSIVVSSIPSGALAAGNPARVIRFLNG